MHYSNQLTNFNFHYGWREPFRVWQMDGSMAHRVTSGPVDVPPDAPASIDALVSEVLGLTAELNRSSALLCGKYTRQQKATTATVTLPAQLSAFADAEQVYQFTPVGHNRPGVLVIPGDGDPPSLLINSERFEWENLYEVHGSDGRTITLPAAHPAFRKASNVFQFQLPLTAQGYQPLLITPAFGLGPGIK